MGNICINTLNAEGTPSQVDELIGKLSEHFSNSFIINDVFATESKATASITIDSQWKMPQKELLSITRSLSDTQGLYIRVTAEEPGEEYFEQSIFSGGKWTFENPPSINSQIHGLTSQGLDEIRKQLVANGNKITLEKDDIWTMLYTDKRGNAASGYLREINLEMHNKISISLSNGAVLVEDEITTNHVLDMLTILDKGNE